VKVLKETFAVPLLILESSAGNLDKERRSENTFVNRVAAHFMLSNKIYLAVVRDQFEASEIISNLARVSTI
jgi:hypothetical protein